MEKLRRYLPRVIFALVFSAFGFYMRDMHFVPKLDVETNILVFFITTSIIVFVWTFFANINQHLDKLIPFDKNPALRILIQTLLGVTLIVGIRLIGGIFIEENLHYKIGKLERAIMLVADVFMALTVNLAVISNYIIKRWKESLTRNELLEKEKTLLQYHHLKNQVNPHFLFNSFSSLQGLIRTDQSLAAKYVGHLAKVYRYVMQHQENELVSLQTEIDFLKDYQEILQIRYENSLQIKLNILPEDLDKKVVNVTLQMLIDNAIKHNEIHPEKPLIIDIKSTGKKLIIQNNIQPRNSLDESNGQGLKQLRTLYSYLSEEPMFAGQEEQHFIVLLPLI
jgi:sensor histidine kinase YesM